MNYRPEIDGLRAVAILPVILFHAGLEFCPGGFLGVDVFFVISGYLITSILFKETKAGTFTLVNFYQRRVRRLIPGLFFMLLLVSLFYLLIARPSFQEGELFGNSMLSSLVFISNLYLPLNSGYFASSSELIPLLHTWSLSVEEQFYLIYPLLALSILKYNAKGFTFIIFLILTSSLILSNLGEDLFGKWNFYLLLTRAWELAAGALCFLCKCKKPLNLPKSFYESFSILGLLLVLSSFFVLDQSIQSPSVWCLFPVIGAVFFIRFCKPATISYRLLSSKVLVYLGLISYGAYLWHHPILSICRHFVIHPSHLPNVVLSLAIIMVFLMASLSYHFIEKPFRKQKLSLKWLLAPFFILLSIGFFPREISMLGLEPRSQKFSESVRDLARTNYDSDLTSEGYYFGGLTNKFNDLLLLGDSHARMLIPSLSEQLKSKNLKGFHPYNKTSKSNFLAVNPGTEESFIDAWQKQIKQFSKNSKVILISFRHTRSRDNYFYDPINSQPSKIYYDNLRRRILHLSALVPKLIIVAPFPESPYWGPNLGRSFFQNENQFDTSTSRYLEIHQQVLSFFRKISEENSSIYIFYPHYFLTNKNSHLSHFGNDNVTNEIIPYYYDDDHLNSDGSKGIVNKIVSSIP